MATFRNAVATGLLYTAMTFPFAVGTLSADDSFSPSQALMPFKQQMQQTLRGAMQEGGPLNAIDVCQTDAPAIAQRASEAAGTTVKMGRSSTRLRNPDNAPQSWLEPVLTAFDDDPMAARPKQWQLDDGRQAYVEPIIAGAPCMACHGQALSEDLSASLNERYPDDQAVGYQVGDLRGVFWVTWQE